MQFRVLGCYGGQTPGCRLPGFLIDGRLLLDAGTVGSVLSLEDQAKISNILISHYHMDHICSLPFYAVNIFGKVEMPIRIHGMEVVLDGIRTHLLNDMIWPDFARIPSPENALFAYKPLVADETVEIAGYHVTPVMVDHLVPTSGYIIRDRESAVVYTSDTGPTSAIWAALDEFGPDGVNADGVRLKAIVTEVSFPNEQQQLAGISCHFTPQDLTAELAKIPVKDVPVFLYHLKPQAYETLRQELDALHVPGHPIEILEQDRTYHW